MMVHLENKFRAGFIIKYIWKIRWGQARFFKKGACNFLSQGETEKFIISPVGPVSLPRLRREC